MALSKNAKIGIGIGAALLIIAIIVAVVMTRKKAAEPVPPPDKGKDGELPKDDVPDDPKDLPDNPPKPALDINPYAPKDVPTQGDFYAVKKNDNIDSILRAAGYSGIIANVKTKTVNHPENAWIGGINQQLGWKAMYQRFKPVPGYEAMPWSYKGAWTSASSSNYRYPVIYIPRPDEVQA
jgi:hypothetical protein